MGGRGGGGGGKDYLLKNKKYEDCTTARGEDSAKSGKWKDPKCGRCGKKGDFRIQCEGKLCE